MSKLDQIKALGAAKAASRKSSAGGVEGHAAGVVPVQPLHAIGSEDRERKPRNGSQAGIKPSPLNQFRLRGWRPASRC